MYFSDLLQKLAGDDEPLNLARSLADRAEFRRRGNISPTG